MEPNHIEREAITKAFEILSEHFEHVAVIASNGTGSRTEFFIREHGNSFAIASMYHSAAEVARNRMVDSMEDAMYGTGEDNPPD